MCKAKFIENNETSPPQVDSICGGEIYVYILEGGDILYQTDRRGVTAVTVGFSHKPNGASKPAPYTYADGRGVQIKFTLFDVRFFG